MKKYQGFTLIELMVTLAVALVLLTVGVPMASSILGNNRVTTQTNALVTALTLARSEAVSRAQNVTLCAANAAQTACAGAGNWDDNGWIVFQDNNGNGSINAGEPILRVWAAPSGRAVMNTAVAAITYDTLGQKIGGQETMDIFQDDGYGSCVGDKKRQLTINAIGQVSSERCPCSSGCP